MNSSRKFSKIISLMLDLSFALSRDLLNCGGKNQQNIPLKIDSRVKFNVGQDERMIEINSFFLKV